MTGIEVPRVSHAVRRSCRESREIDPSWGRVDVAEPQLPTTHGDHKELERHVVIGRAAQEFVGYERVNVSHKAIPDVVDIRDVA